MIVHFSLFLLLAVSSTAIHITIIVKKPLAKNLSNTNSSLNNTIDHKPLAIKTRKLRDTYNPSFLLIEILSPVLNLFLILKTFSHKTGKKGKIY